MMGLSSKVASFNFGLDFWYQELLGHGGLFDIPQPINQARNYNYTANIISNNFITNQHHHDHHMQQQQQLQKHSPRLSCPRCHSSNTKFCYFNNYSKSQPRHFCKSCRRHWTAGGTLRNIPVGGGRKNKRQKTNNTTTSSSSSAATSATTLAASPSFAIQNSGIASSTGMTSVPQSTQQANNSSNLQLNGDYISNIIPEILEKGLINSQSQPKFQLRSSPSSNHFPKNHIFSSQFQPAINNLYDNLDDTKFSISSFLPSVSMSKDQEIVSADATVTATTSATASLPAVNSAWQGLLVSNDSSLTPTIATGYWSCWDDDMGSITIGGDDSHFQP